LHFAQILQKFFGNQSPALPHFSASAFILNIKAFAIDSAANLWYSFGVAPATKFLPACFELQRIEA
jgi:hypothetical protein